LKPAKITKAIRFYGLSLLFLLGFPAHAQIGAIYSLDSFKPYLERGYNTRIGWQGGPVHAEFPHLYLHSSESLKLLAELEFGHSNGRIHTQLIKLQQALKQISSQERQELLWFALEASGGKLQPSELQHLLETPCLGEWQVITPQQTLYVTFFTDQQSTYLRFSERGRSSTPKLSQCR